MNSRSAILLTAFLLSASPSLRGTEQSGTEAPASSHPSIIFIMADQYRGDALGADGNQAVRTPHLDRLAGDGCLFKSAYSSTPSCTPARAAVLTGMSPWGHGMLGYHRVAKEYPAELPTLLNDAGYTTHAIGKNHFHPQRHRHGYQGVELDESGRVESKDFISDYRRWFQEVAPGKNPDETGFGWNDYRSGLFKLPEDVHPTRWTGDRAVAFISSRPTGEPFFLKVSFARPHSPYDPPTRFMGEYDSVEAPRPFLGSWSEEKFARFVSPENHTSARNNLGWEITSASRLAYYANITFVDEQVGRIVEALEKSGRLENSVILFTSDHGDMLGDHHLWRKTYAYEGSARIPMVLWWGSDANPARRGQVRSEVVELRDVLPTFLDAAGEEMPQTVEGRSLLSLVDGRADSWREYLDLEHATCYWKENVWNALTDGHFKYIYHAYEGKEQLFNLDRDPGETVDLASNSRYGKRLASWRTRMIEHLEPRGAPWVVDGELGRRTEKILTGANYPPGGQSR